MTNPKHTDTSRSGDLVKECRLDAKAFRENTVYDSDGDPIRLIANAERLDQYADRIEAQAQQIDTLTKAHDLWCEKTEWVQTTAQTQELGLHRADVLRLRIEALEAENERLREALRMLDEAYCNDDYSTLEGKAKGRAALVAARAALGDTK